MSRMGFKPKSHPESVVTLDDAAESAIVFGLSRRVSVRCTLHYCAEEQQQELTKYTFITKTNDEVTFSLRFIYTGNNCKFCHELEFHAKLIISKTKN